MQQLTVMVPITLKAVVTEALRAELREEVEAGIAQLDFEIQQIEFQGRRALNVVEREDLQGAIALRGRIEEEKKKRTEAKAELKDRLDEITSLPEGAEIARGNVQTQVSIKPGDDLAALTKAELVVKDGIVMEIRMNR